MKTHMARLIGVVCGWVVVAWALGASGVLVRLPAGVVPAVAVVLTIGVAVAVFRVPWVRATLAAVNLRWLVAAHLVRFVGGYFVWLHAHGRLPAGFAHPAGWGDVAVAAGALLLLFWPENASFRRLVRGWNVLGALDFLVAIGTAAWMNASAAGSMSEMVRFPLAAVPLCAVPVLFGTHLVIFRRLAPPEPGARIAAAAV